MSSVGRQLRPSDPEASQELYPSYMMEDFKIAAVVPAATTSTFIWTWLIPAVLTLTLATRAYTQIWSTFRTLDSNAGTKSISRLPYWIPYFGTTPLFALRPQSSLLTLARTFQSGVFALRLSGQDYIVITLPALQAQLTDPATPISTRLYTSLRSRHFFNNLQATDNTLSRISTALETYSNDAARSTKLTRLLEAHAYNFISPANSWVDQAQWERTAEVTVLSESPTLSVSASLATLVKDFSSHILLSTLLSTSFIEANPGFIGDFFTFSSKYAVFMTGLPYWLGPGLGPPALARERCLLTLDGLVAAIIADIDGRSMQGTGAGMLYDLEDVHPAIWDVVRQARSENSRVRTRTIACEVLEIIWHTTFSSTAMVTWMLIHLFSDEDSNQIALQSIRDESKSIVEVEKPKPTGLPFEDPPRLKFNTDFSDKTQGAWPNLKSALLEVQRLETEPEEYLTVTNDFVLQGNPTSGASEKFQLKTGDHIYAAYGATNKDSRFWDRPKRFAPKRFILKQDDNAKESVVKRLPRKRSAHATSLEADVLCIVAALLAFYDISSLDNSGLAHPGTNTVAGIGIPKNATAKVTRRPIV